MATACDFEVVTIGKKHKGGQRSKEAVNAAMRTGGDVATEKKYSAGSNKQSSANKNTSKLDRETDELHHEHVPLDVSKLIQLSRQNKGFTQKELATKINEKPQVINEYESGKAIPNQQVLGKLERTLGVKLRGKDKGKPFGAGPKK